MTNQEIIAVLQDNAYILKQHINLCADAEKATPLRAYENTLKAINELQPGSQHIEDIKLLTDEEPAQQGAGALLIDYGLLNSQQVNYYKNYNFIARCDKYMQAYGQQRFIDVLLQIKDRQDKGVKINNMYAYINRSLDNDIKDRSGNA